MNDDIFGENQTPEDKFFQILCSMNKDVVRNELAKLFEKLVVLEKLSDDVDVEKKIRAYKYENAQQLERMLQNLYLHITADMIAQHE
ncbi:MAG: hypothetical protein QG567_2265 [Campylobacterota bacterium]|nr:hypothetical protein [Campylobacterota bacterium]